MLERLEIHHYALIEDSVIEFPGGFSVITGETGAGKSILLGALTLLLGEKTEVQSIRSGCDSATVSASFHIAEPMGAHLASYLAKEELELEDDTLVASRTIKSNGRSSITIQGRLATRSELALITAELLDISAQRDHQSLLSTSHQLSVLDSFGSCGAEKSAYKSAYDQYQSLKAELERVQADLEAAKREMDYLSYAVDEIEKVNPKPMEDEEIANQVQVIASFEHIHEALSQAVSLLHGNDQGLSTLALLHQVKTQLDLAGKADPSLQTLGERLESSTIEIEDIYESVRDYLNGMAYSEEELDRLQGRLAQLQRLKKKYGPNLEAVQAFLAKSKEKLSLSEQGEIVLSKLEKQIKLAYGTLLEQARALQDKRKASALLLSGEVEEKLRTLGMKEAVFSIAFTQTSPTASGIDEVSFQICANPGLEMRSIKDVASGGELSRIMLAVKTSLAQSDAIPTLIFDEVDAGIGGSVALSVAEQLKNLARTHQVIVITHLASIASKADHHLVVSKEIRNAMSYSTISPVKGEQRQREIARMLSGDDTSQESLGHARKLLEKGS
ncbi:MAG: DNA repair protein RecN [Sphaerochaeta sp.]|jgi:DNA repair protein RecN (Recombination protein N)|uniref:DNA repair protein RecN n=1 Tax=unclassified Sphaerochaeta TaxID=2637943 RepID=UPI0025D1D2A7|nr:MULTISPECIES: DNA repair protein RecN [unclassified Sphaerochaeta]MCK9600400.1 DNA repair protein RecN [Sphaerochaeta sp.]MDX9823445.1 DNA repair protein RecN [Sphaerochaeta sp.]HPE93945.1 DNA repair protein RecN [Sphaerochaeta sp.]